MKQSLDVFVCTGKDCTKAWNRVCGGRPGKWLKRLVRDQGLNVKLNVIKTGCMDRCEEAGCISVCGDEMVARETDIRSERDAYRLIEAVKMAGSEGGKVFAFD